MPAVIIARVRRVAIAGTVGLSILVGAGTAGGTGTPRVVCPGGATTVLFWPHGHPAIPEIGFPAFPSPHLDVYRTGRYEHDDFRAFIGPGAGSWGPRCRGTAGAPSPNRIAKAAKLDAGAALVCRFTSSAIQLERADAPGRSTLKIFVAYRLYVAAVVQAAGSFVSYNTAVCGPRAPPS
jgi:hypothetical protein